jgi:hypothetical protein
MLLLHTSVYCVLSFGVLAWSATHVVCARHVITFILFYALAFVFQLVHPSFKYKPPDVMFSNLIDFLSFCPYVYSAFGGYWKFSSAGHDSFGFLRQYLEPGVFRHLIIIFIAFCIWIVATRWCWCVACIQSSA